MTRPQPPERLEQVLIQAGRGDAQAWRVLVEAYSTRVYALLVKQCGDRELAQELTQDTFVRVVGKIGEYREQGRFESWLFRVAMNRLRDEMRRRKRHARPTDFSPAGLAANREAANLGQAETAHLPPAQAEHREQVQRVLEAVATLPPADQQILHLRHTAGLTFQQIAETLDQPLGTVLARGHRALAKLREMFADEL